MASERRDPTKRQEPEGDRVIDPEPLHPERPAVTTEDVLHTFDPEHWKELADDEDDGEDPPYVRSDAPIPPG